MPNRKLVMEEHDGSVLVGVLQDGCDPVISTKAGAIEAVLTDVPDFLKEAQEKWAVSPKNPAYKAPPPPKPEPRPTATPAPTTKTEELPLLAGTEKPQPAAEIEAAAEEKAPEAVAEATEPQAAPAEIEPEPEVPPAEPEAVEPAEGAVAEEKTAWQATQAAQELSERIAQAPAPAEVAIEGEEKTAMSQMAEQAPAPAAKPGEWEYCLEDGRGPFESVQLAMDALGLDKDKRPTHNRWDRLSTFLKEKIQRRPKS